MNRKFKTEQHLFEIIINTLMPIFNQLNLSLLNKFISFLKKLNDSKLLNNSIYYIYFI